MKQQHTYERMIREKLNGLAAPARPDLWASMENILDREMPQEEEKKRRSLFWGSNTNLLLAAGILLMVGSTFTVRRFATGNNAAPEAKTDVAEQRTKSSVPVIAAREKETTKAVTSLTAETLATNDNTNSGHRRNKIANETIAVRYTAASVATDKMNDASIVANSNINASDVAISSNDRSREIRPVAMETPVSSVKEVNIDVPVINVPEFSISQPGKQKKTNVSNKGFSAGISISHPFAVNGQNKNDLDINGRKSNWQNYIPSAYVQYHVNKKLYVQAEFQPAAAQHTPRFTLYDNVWFADPLNPDEKDEKIVRLNKLFYTNVPVSVHYSPVKNLTLGLGAQYSKLKKVILQDEEYHYTWSMYPNIGVWTKDELKNAVVAKDPNSIQHSSNDVADSVARSIRKEEIRLLADASYSYKNFSVGVRYTKSLNNSVNTNFTNLPLKDKNQSVQVYLRYNIFDTRK